jgi:predicted short-subunit dehydrogenase-like oxidoreductase (DUF2520 family)
MAHKSKRPSVSLVGSGRLGTALAVALAAAGYPLDAVVARRGSSARKTARFLGGHTLSLAVNQLRLLPSSRLTIISTPDDAIGLIARRLAELQRGKADGRIFLHTSGALSSEALSPLADRGFAVGSLHPLLAVTSRGNGVQSLNDAFWCVEGKRAATKVARTIVSDLGGQSFSIKAEKKPLYHAAALMASGHVVALFDIAIEMLVSSGLTAERARELLLPLVESNTRNLATLDPPRALTGTFARGDFATVQRHLLALSTSGLKDALTVYKLLGARSMILAEKIRAHRRAPKKIRKSLEVSTTEASPKKRK